MPKVIYTSAASLSAGVGVSSGAASVPSSSGVLAGSNASAASPLLPISFPLPSPFTAAERNPFGTLPAVKEFLFKNDSRKTASEQPLNAKATSSLIPRNVLQGTKLRSHSHRHPLNGEAQQALFRGTDSIRIPREDFSFVPLEDPRALVISEMHPKEHSFEHHLKDATPRSKSQDSDVQVASTSTSTPTRCLMESRQECNDDTPRSNSERSDVQVASSTSTSTSARYLIESRLECNDDHPLAHPIDARRRALSYAEKHSTDVAKSLPKLGKPDYYTSPGMEELMQRERATPGFCSKVPDIVVGCKGHGRIKFLGETDVRGLKLDDIVAFKTNGDVSVYANDSNVPIGKGLNKPAEVTLENIRPGMDKDTGKQQEIDEFIEELKCKSTEQGTQYMSYDSEKGEWTFGVQHF